MKEYFSLSSYRPQWRKCNSPISGSAYLCYCEEQNTRENDLIPSLFTWLPKIGSEEIILGRKPTNLKFQISLKNSKEVYEYATDRPHRSVMANSEHLGSWINHLRGTLLFIIGFLFTGILLLLPSIVNKEYSVISPVDKRVYVYGKPMECVTTNYTDNIYFAVKTTAKNHRTRLSTLLLTWLQTVNKNKVIGMNNIIPNIYRATCSYNIAW